MYVPVAPAARAHPVQVRQVRQVQVLLARPARAPTPLVALARPPVPAAQAAPARPAVVSAWRCVSGIKTHCVRCVRIRIMAGAGKTIKVALAVTPVKANRATVA